MKILFIIITILLSSMALAENLYPIKFDVSRIYDGDSIMDTLVTLPFGLTKKTTIRLLGINAPEITGKTKVAGTISRDFLRSKVDSCPSLTVSLHGADAFGRELVKLYCDKISLNDEMLKHKMAVEFMK